MDAKEVKKLLEPIPNKDFIENKYTDDVGKCCAVGHLVRLKSDNPEDYYIGNCRDRINDNQGINEFVRIKVNKFLLKKYDLFRRDLSDVNNFDYINGYTDNDIKDRVMKLLDDMIKAGY